MMFKVITDDGTLVQNGINNSNGLTAEEAKAGVEDRNKRAEELGIKTRYKIAPLAS